MHSYRRVRGGMRGHFRYANFLTALSMQVSCKPVSCSVASTLTCRFLDRLHQLGDRPVPPMANTDAALKS